MKPIQAINGTYLHKKVRDLGTRMDSTDDIYNRRSLDSKMGSESTLPIFTPSHDQTGLESGRA
jgi:hypothetical protein